LLNKVFDGSYGEEPEISQNN